MVRLWVIASRGYTIHVGNIVVTLRPCLAEAYLKDKYYTNPENSEFPDSQYFPDDNISAPAKYTSRRDSQTVTVTETGLDVKPKIEDVSGEAVVKPHQGATVLSDSCRAVALESLGMVGHTGRNNAVSLTRPEPHVNIVVKNEPLQEDGVEQEAVAAAGIGSKSFTGGGQGAHLAKCKYEHLRVADLHVLAANAHDTLAEVHRALARKSSPAAGSQVPHNREDSEQYATATLYNITVEYEEGTLFVEKPHLTSSRSKSECDCNPELFAIKGDQGDIEYLLANEDAQLVVARWTPYNINSTAAATGIQANTSAIGGYHDGSDIETGNVMGRSVSSSDEEAHGTELMQLPTTGEEGGTGLGLELEGMVMDSGMAHVRTKRAYGDSNRRRSDRDLEKEIHHARQTKQGYAKSNRWNGRNPASCYCY
ncbi:hypothetical protein K474DRAFT_1696741 [Panus rudis PR-1116 ss-1]|nr:hypothetical protein K474DRAFT_1696741 [Panus rudis PR-1116 ss-1]